MPEGFEELTLNWRSALTGSLMLCSALVAIAITRKGIETTASLLLSAFVLASCVTAVPNLIGFAGAYDIWPGLTFLPTETHLFLGPLILLHARALMIGAWAGRFGWLLAPGAAYYCYQIWAFTMLGDYRAKWAYTDSIHDPFIVPIITALTSMMTVGCLVYVVILRRRYLAWLENNHTADEQFDPAWLTHLSIVGLVAALYWSAISIINLWYELSYFASFPLYTIGLFLVFVIALEALVRINRPYPKMEDVAAHLSAEQEALPARDWGAEGAMLRSKVIENEWFLEPDLSLQSLSRRYGMNHAYISRAVNEGLGCNFNTFINRLRVDYAKDLIERVDDPLALTQIALASGFGSKASFNRAFKIHAGKSPSEYRKAVPVK